MIENIILLLLAALPLMGSPGPGTLSITASSSVFGIRRSLWFFTGVNLGTTGVLLMIATGVSGVLFAIPAVLPVISAAALCYILYLAYKIATAPVLGDEAGDQTPPSFVGGFALAIANPKAYAAIGAVYSSVVILPEQPILDAVVKLATLVCVIVAVHTTWLVLGSSLARVLRHPRTGRVINIVFAVLLVISVAMAGWGLL